MTEPRSLMAVFAHPDDESVNMGGTFARCAHEGVELSLICATSGEWGTISDPAMVSRENLAATREAELRAACEVLGIGWLRFLDCPDGGINTAVWPQVEEKIVRYIRERRPQVVVTFGPDGMYGHDDHIAIGALTTAAFKAAADRAARLYYVAFPRTLMRGAAAAIAAEHLGAHFWDIPAEQFGVPADLITTEIDVAAVVRQKLTALRCHRTQLDESNAYRVVSEETARQYFGREYFRRIVPPPGVVAIEDTLFG